MLLIAMRWNHTHNQFEVLLFFGGGREGDSGGGEGDSGVGG